MTCEGRYHLALLGGAPGAGGFPGFPPPAAAAGAGGFPGYPPPTPAAPKPPAAAAPAYDVQATEVNKPTSSTVVRPSQACSPFPATFYTVLATSSTT